MDPVVSGQKLVVRITCDGDQPHQGVGLQADGSIVVVEGGIFSIGNTITIKVTSVLETPAGRMIFGELAMP
jgi:uncharacterized protein YacL